jgi:hypothetical protein
MRANTVVSNSRIEILERIPGRLATIAKGSARFARSHGLRIGQAGLQERTHP